MFAGSTLAEDPTKLCLFRGGSRTAATSKMEHFVIIVNSWKPLTITTKSSILDVAEALDPPLLLAFSQEPEIPKFSMFEDKDWEKLQPNISEKSSLI